MHRLLPRGILPELIVTLGLGDRAQASGRGSAPDPMAQPLRHLLAPLRQGYTPMVNSIYNGNRFEDIWLDK
jgi:hypothetical protein